MKLPCEIVQDLLPLYEENLCSEVSRKAIEEHLEECIECRRMINGLQQLEEPELSVDICAEEQAVTKSFRKLHNRWRASLLAMLLVIPMIIMAVNQIRHQGICFTNLDEILVVWRYVQAMEEGNFEKAADFMHYEDFHEYIKSVQVEWPNGMYGDYQTELLGEEEWMVSRSFYNEYLRWETEVNNFWSNIILNGVQPVMVPEEIWKEITSLEPDSVTETEDGEFVWKDKRYICLETKWGTYITEQSSGLKNCLTAEDFCLVLELIPKEIWDEAYPDLEKQDWEAYYERQAKFDEADNMTLEEFTDLVRTKYIMQLQTAAEQGIRVKGTGYEGSYYSDGDAHWNVAYGILVTTEEEEYPVTVHVSVKDRKIVHAGSFSHRQEMADEDVQMLSDMFRMWYSR